jgi:phospholipase/lecithinase/hemolysin
MNNTGEKKMSGNLKKLLAAISLASISLFSGTAWASYTSLYVFGDSLADSGNNAVVFDLYYGGARTPTPLSGPTIPDYPYAPSNTYSNGQVWTQYFAGSLGLSATPSLLGGTNYAFAGARTGPSGSSFPYSMVDQVNMAFGAPGANAPSTALYVVEGGGNDARDVLNAALTGQDPSALIFGYASNIASILMTLSSEGADQFLLWNIPDIGKIPAITSLGPEASVAASYLVGLMNQALLDALSALPADVSDGVHFFDAFGAFNSLVGDPSAFGFSNVSSPCAMSQACIDDPMGYFFWDGIHPTTAGHAVLSNLSLATIPEPGTILLLAIALVGMAVSRRKAA